MLNYLIKIFNNFQILYSIREQSGLRTSLVSFRTKTTRKIWDNNLLLWKFHISSEAIFSLSLRIIWSRLPKGIDKMGELAPFLRERGHKLYRFEAGAPPANSFIRRKSFQLKTFPFKETARERRNPAGNSIAIDCVAPITQLLGSVKCQAEIGIQPIYLPYNLLRNSCTGE